MQCGGCRQEVEVVGSSYECKECGYVGEIDPEILDLRAQLDAAKLENERLNMELNLTCAKCAEALEALEELLASKKAEEDYRWEYIGQYPDTKIPDEVRQGWLDALSIISQRQNKAWNGAKVVLAKHETNKEREARDA